MLLAMLILSVITSGPQDKASDKVWISAKEVWMRTAAGDVQLTHDNAEKRLPTISPDGSRIVYLIDRWDQRHQGVIAEEEVVEISTRGKVVQRILPDAIAPEPFERLEWIDNQRIGAMVCGHANCDYWILDASSGKTIQRFEGGFDFVWSHNRNWVARRMVTNVDLPNGDTGEEDDSLLLNETQLYPGSSAEDHKAFEKPLHSPPHAHSFGAFHWSPNDNWIAFTDGVIPEGDVYLVLASPEGTILRDTIPAEVQFDSPVRWNDDTHLIVNADRRSFKCVIEGNDLTCSAE